MSARNTNDPNRRQASRQSAAQADFSFRRLARVPKKSGNTTNKTSSTADSFAINFYANNPDIPLDKRSPQEKLDEINAKLQDLDLDDNDKFNILVQKKAICSLAYGDNSPESFEALYQLGSFYNEQNRPDSGLRHLLKAQEISKTIDTTDDQNFAIAIEIADSYITIPPKNKQEQNRNLANAENSIKPYEKFETSDQILIYKKFLIFARINSCRGQFATAFRFYEQAYLALDAANQAKITEQMASLFIEMGECAENGGDPKQALEMFQRAQSAFDDLEMTESAQLLNSKINELTKKVQKEEANLQSDQSDI